MRKLRFNIASLVILILVLGVSFAALRESSDLWESGLFTATLGLLLLSILLAVYRADLRRAFWIGFALVGSIYLGLTLIPSVESRLITTKFLAYLDSKVPGRLSGVVTFRLSGTGSAPPYNTLAFTVDGSQLATSNQGQVKLWNVTTGKLLGGWSGTTENFVRIGHSQFALLLGWIGAQLCRRIRRASRHPGNVAVVEAGGSIS